VNLFQEPGCVCHPLNGFLAELTATDRALCPVHEQREIAEREAQAKRAAQLEREATLTLIKREIAGESTVEPDDTDPLTRSLTLLASQRDQLSNGVPLGDHIVQSAADLVGGTVDNGHGDLPPAA
jgi:hypothetical protein